MPQKTFVVPHCLSKNVVVILLVAHLFQEVCRELKEDHPAIYCRWNKDRGEFQFTAMGKPVRALVNLLEDTLEAKFAVEVNQEMGIFLETIEHAIRNKAEYLFANSEAVIAASMGQVPF